MTDEPLLTLRAIASELGLPESTVRYYRDRYAAFLPSVGRGRRRRYPPETLQLLRLIADQYAENRSRPAIEATLVQATGTTPVTPVSVAAPAGVTTFVPGPADDTRQLLATVLDGERERREVMWQMARELVRLGEAVERQHAVLADIALRVERQATRALPASVPPTAGDGDGIGMQDTAPVTSAPPDAEVQTLRDQLSRERDLVERLRRSKLEIERRAAEAEEALIQLRGRGGGRSNVIDRVLRRDQGSPD